MAALEAEVTRTLRGIERGIEMLDERRASYAVPEPDEPGADDVHTYIDDVEDEEQGASPAGRR